MLLRIDHLVIAVRDPEVAATELEAAVGLRSTSGGRHPTWGTYNRIAWLGDTYVELIGLFDRTLAPHAPISRAVLAAEEAGATGLVTYAIATDDVDADHAALVTAGSSLRAPETRSRTRSDGETIRWRAAYGELGPAQPPFIVEHEPSGSEWGDAARAERETATHPLGGRPRIVALELPVPNVQSVADDYEREVGIAFTDVDPRSARTTIGDQVVRLHHGAPLWNPAIVDLRVLAPDGAAIDLPDGARREMDALGVRWRIVA